MQACERCWLGIRCVCQHKFHHPKFSVLLVRWYYNGNGRTVDDILMSIVVLSYYSGYILWIRSSVQWKRKMCVWLVVAIRCTCQVHYHSVIIIITYDCSFFSTYNMCALWYQTKCVSHVYYRQNEFLLCVLLVFASVFDSYTFLIDNFILCCIDCSEICSYYALANRIDFKQIHKLNFYELNKCSMNAVSPPLCQC